MTPSSAFKRHSQHELEILLGKWRKHLRLDEWTLRIQRVTFKRPWQSGDVKVDFVEKTALVLLADQPFRDEEETLVHELVHVILWPLDNVAMDLTEVVGPKDSPARDFAESAVFRALEPVTEHLARALLGMEGHLPVAAWASLKEQARERAQLLLNPAE